MDANGRELVLKREVYAVVGCALEVLKGLGHGLNEKVYEKALCVEFRLRAIAYETQQRHQIVYKREVVAEYIPDLVVDPGLVVETKTIERLSDHERGQMLNYLRITRLPVGLIFNFKHARLEWERIVLSSEPRMSANERPLGKMAADFRT